MVLSFNYFKVHAWSTSIMLLLHIAQGCEDEVGDCALNSHGSYIVNHGNIMELFFLNSYGNPVKG